MCGGVPLAVTPGKWQGRGVANRLGDWVAAWFRHERRCKKCVGKERCERGAELEDKACCEAAAVRRVLQECDLP